MNYFYAFIPMRNIRFHHLLANQYDIPLFSSPKIGSSIAAVLKTIQTAYLQIAILRPSQPGTLPRHGRIKQLQAGIGAFLLTHRQRNLIALLRIPPVPDGA
jgi:hypothetical protein